MTQYKTQYGTIFAVKEHNGAPAIMCRAELSETWSLSSMITPFTPGAWTAEELQGQLDNWAATKGWQPVEAPASVEPPETADEGGEPEDGFPDWVRPMVEAFLQFDFVRELPAFTTAAFKNSEPVRHHWGGSLADGLYDTGPKGIKFSVFRSPNNDHYREASYTWAGFVRRCRAAGLEPGLREKEEPPRPRLGHVYRSPKSGQLYKIGELTNGKKTCYLTMRSNAQGSTWVPANSSVYPNLSDAQGEFEAWIRTEQLEPVAPTGAAAAATTAASAAPQPSQAAETSTGSPGNSADASSCPSAEPVRQAPAALPLSAPDTAPTNLPAFDFGGLDADTAEKLRGITDCVMELYQTYAWGMAYQVGRAHDLLCGDGACETVSQAHKRNNQHSENTFTAWCAYIGVERRSAYNLLNAYRLICKATPEQQRNLQLAPAKLLYEAGKKDVPDQLADAVMNGDITKTKQFQDAKREWQAKLDAEHAAREQAEQQRDEAVTHIQAARDMQIDTARERDAALRRATEAEKQRDGAREALTASKLRGDKLKAENEALKAQPVEAQVVDEEEVNRRAQARADELTAPLREELEALRACHPTDLEEAEQAIRDAYDSAIYTGRVMENAWHTLRPLLPRMDAHRRELAIQQVSKTLAQIQGEIAACL